jgi:hypothetical protein
VRKPYGVADQHDESREPDARKHDHPDQF